MLFMLALLPACNQNRVAVKNQRPHYGVQNDQTIVAAPQQDDVAAFELHEDENPFNNMIATDEYVPSVAAGALEVDQNKYGFKDMYYEFNKYGVSQDQKAALEHNKNIAKDLVNQGNTIVIEGHACDSAGSSEYNFQLSEKRAEHVADALVESGIDRKKIYTKGCGAEQLRVKTGDKEEQAPNRRVEFHAYPANTPEEIAA